MRRSAESNNRWFPSICVSLFGPSSWGNAPNILLTDTSSQKIVPRSSQDTVVCRWYCCCSSRTLSSSILWLLPLLLALFKWEGSDLPFLPHPRTPSPFSRSVAAILPSPSLPTLSLPASHGLCLWLNAGILSQRLPVAKRDGAPEEAGQNVCGSLRVRRRLFILLFPPSSPSSLSSSFLSLYSFSVLTSKKLRLISVCPVIRFFPLSLFL